MSKKRKPDQKPEETESFEEKFLKMSMKLFEIQHPVLSPEGVMEKSITRSLAERSIPRTISRTSPMIPTVSINAVPEDPEEDYEAYMDQDKAFREITNQYNEEKKLTQGDQVRNILQSIVAEHNPVPEDLTEKYIDFAIIERGTAYICMQKSIDPDLKQPLADPVKRSMSAIGNRLYSFAHKNAPFFLNPDGTVDGLKMITQFEADERRKAQLADNVVIPKVLDSIMPVTKAGNQILAGEITPGKEVSILAAHDYKHNNKPVMTSVMISYEQLKDKTGSEGIEKTIKRLGPKERAVYDACSTVILANPNHDSNTPYLISTIAKEMFKTNDPTQNQIQQTKTALQNLMTVLLTIDYTDHYKNVHNDIKQCKFVEQLIQASIIDIVLKDGSDVSAIVFSQIPVLLRYANDVNQILRIDTSVLRVKDTVKAQDEAKAMRINGEYWNRLESMPKMSEKRAILIGYLVRRIHAMYGKAAKSIRIDALYDVLGGDLTRTQKLDCRNFTELVLRSFCFDGIIKDFKTETGARNSVSGYVLTLVDPKENPFIKSNLIDESVCQE